MSARRLVIAALVVLVLAVAGGVAALIATRAAPTVIIVEKGDTLFELATDHGVTVDDLRGWNDLEGDLIEIGQVLLVYPTRRGVTGPAVVASPVPMPSNPRGRTRAAAAAPATPQLTLPPENPCLAGPSLEGAADEAMAASQGLSHEQVRRAMGGFVHHTLTCLQGTDASPSDALRLEIRVACTGRVADVSVLDQGDWPSAVATCVADTLKFAPFPAHDLPDGETFEYPLRYTP
jgi:hypothetical protein